MFSMFNFKANIPYKQKIYQKKLPIGELIIYFYALLILDLSTLYIVLHTHFAQSL